MINLGILPVLSPSADAEPFLAFTRRLADDIGRELARVTGVEWMPDVLDPSRLANDEPRRPSDYLDEASLHMVEGPYDLVLVVTDVAVVSRRQRVVSGLASTISRIAVLSTRKLLLSPRGLPLRRLDQPTVRYNAAGLALHLVGRLLGLRRGRADAVMGGFRVREDLSAVPRFGAESERRLRLMAPRVPERTRQVHGPVSAVRFHLTSATRHAGAVLATPWRNRAVFLPLSLPGLAAAAVAPVFILVFTAEIWDVGLNLAPWSAAIFAGASIIGATWYLLQAQNLFLPQKERRLLTEHLAAINVAVLLTMLLAMVGLFLMMVALILFIEFFIFPEGLIATWPTLEDPEVSLLDRFVLAAFISTNGVITGSLAGGLQSRSLLRHLALFDQEV